MRVIAKQQGFFGGSRRRAGATFEMPESAMKKDSAGKPVLPDWVVEASSDAAAQIAAAKGAEVRKNREAAVAASGGAAAKRKVEQGSDLV